MKLLTRAITLTEFRVRYGYRCKRFCPGLPDELEHGLRGRSSTTGSSSSKALGGLPQCSHVYTVDRDV